jgi:hypothetical protein
MTSQTSRLIVLVLLLVSIGLLIPGLFAPVLTIRGVLTREGIANVAPVMLEKGLSDETVGVLKSMMNPTIVGFLEATGGNVRKIVIDKLGPQITAALQRTWPRSKSTSRRAASSVGAQALRSRKPRPGDTHPAFQRHRASGQAALVAWAVFMANQRHRKRTLAFVETIAKWSMADVFVVALFIAYLAAQASATPTSGPNAAPPMIAFTARFGPGFYWFATYCLFSLASQQFTHRVAASALQELEAV